MNTNTLCNISTFFFGKLSNLSITVRDNCVQSLPCRFPAVCNCRLIALFIEPYFIFQVFFQVYKTVATCCLL